MLEELRDYKVIGSKEDIDYIIFEVFGEKKLTLSDALLINVQNNKNTNDFHAILKLLIHFNILSMSNEKYCIVQEIMDLKPNFNDWFVGKITEELCNQHYLTNEMFEFISDKRLYLFKKECFSLKLGQLRDLLVSYGFFNIERNEYGVSFYVAPKYERTIETLLMKNAYKMSLEDLRKQLLKNIETGEKAEKFVIEYEYKRLELESSSLVRQVSIIDVTAGYDIASFNTSKSTKYDRFIEVKAVNSNLDFYWSKSEILAAKIREESYFIYLVEMKKITQKDYNPIIIQNPYLNIHQSNEWLLEPDSFKVTNVFD